MSVAQVMEAYPGQAGAFEKRSEGSVGQMSEPSWLLEGIEEEEGYPRSAPLEQADASKVQLAQGVSYDFAIDLFNGKEVPTGLRNTRVELVLDTSYGRLRSIPHDLTTIRDGQLYPGIPGAVGAVPAALGGINNLLPRQIVHKELHGRLGGTQQSR